MLENLEKILEKILEILEKIRNVRKNGKIVRSVIVLNVFKPIINYLLHEYSVIRLYLMTMLFFQENESSENYN